MSGERATQRTHCVQCENEMASTATNFCTVCCHNGLNDELVDEHGYFQHDRTPEPEFEYIDEPAETAQAGLGDFTGTEASAR